MILITLLLLSLTTTVTAAGGSWTEVVNNTGISAMHMQLLHVDSVLMYDRTDFGPSNLTLPGGECIQNPNATVMKTDCSAHSALFEISNKSVRPLTVKYDFWCSSGAVSSDGVVVQTGGNLLGSRVVRKLDACPTCEWDEIADGLAVPRWYATDHVLPDGGQIIVGGRGQPSYEFFPKTNPTDKAIYLPFLQETSDGPKIENNLYPFVLLNVDGSLFIFANNRAILYDYTGAKVIREFPAIPGGDPRSYPSTGSAVLLPLNLSQENIEAEVLICGGAPRGSFSKAQSGVFWEALNTCGRISITGRDPQWSVETMPHARVMTDMVLLPTADVLLINGASRGTAGWELGRDPVLSPVIYSPKKPIGSRFVIQTPTSIPRMYHSTAVLLPDGRVLVGGSNPHDKYEFAADVLYPTELSLQAFVPDYLDSSFDLVRPKIDFPPSHSKVGYGQELAVGFSIEANLGSLSVTLLSPSFNTHSFSMNQRLLILSFKNVKDLGGSKFQVMVTFPDSKTLAPAGFYLLFVVHEAIPSPGLWVRMT